MPDYINVDCNELVKPDVLANLGMYVWPWPDNSVDEVRASHVLEHLPGADFFFFLQELYRVCKPGAKVLCILPHPSHDIFLSDPTHVRAVMPQTLAMFSKRYVQNAAKAGSILTSFYEHYGVDFNIDTITYSYDPSVKDDPNLEWMSKHLRNIIHEWRTTLTVVK